MKGKFILFNGECLKSRPFVYLDPRHGSSTGNSVVYPFRVMFILLLQKMQG